MILGEHGDSMVPIWSAAQAGGMPLEKFPGWNAAQAEALFTRTKGSGEVAEVIKPAKGSAGSPSGFRSPTSSTRSHAISGGSCPCRRWSAAPMASATSAYRCRRSSAARGSRPSSRIEPSGPSEVAAPADLAQVLRETIDQVLKNPSDRPSEACPAQAPAAAAEKGGKSVRVTMGSGGGNGYAGGSRVTISGQKSGGRNG